MIDCSVATFVEKCIIDVGTGRLIIRKEECAMFVDSFDREQLDDAKLARMHPEAYEVKMKARAEWNPMRDVADFFRWLFVRKAK